MQELRALWTRIVARARRRYSVLVVSGPEGRLRQFQIPGILIPAAVGLAAAGFVGGGAVVLDWASQRAERIHLAALELENLRLGEQVADMKQSVDMFETRMNEQLEIERTFRSLANLSPIPRKCIASAWAARPRSRSWRTRPRRPRSCARRARP